MDIELMQDFTFKHSDESGNLMNVGDPTTVKANLDSQAVELRNYIIGLVNILNSMDGADNLSAKGYNSLKTTIQAMLNDLNSRKLDITGDFKGTLNGLPIVAADPGQSSIVAAHTSQLYDYVSVKKFGAKGDGVTDDRTAILNAVTFCIGGQKLYFPKGDYLIGSPLAWTLTSDLEIEMDINARIFASPNFEGKMLQFLNGQLNNYPRFVFSGGTIDSANVAFGTGDSNDALWIQGADGVTIKGVTFTFGEDYTTPEGDGFALINCRNVLINDCLFYGAPDSAIYITGDGDTVSTTDNGYNTIISGCRFVKCQTGVTSKRDNRGIIVDGNTFYHCQYGVIPLEVIDGTNVHKPASAWIITNNLFKFIHALAIESRLADGSIISNNRIEDIGYDLTGAVSAGFPTGIQLKGSSKCIITNNYIGFKDWTPNIAFTRGIFFKEFIFNSVTYYSTKNLIQGNIVESFQYGIIEEVANDGENTIGINEFYGCTTDVMVKNTDTIFVKRNHAPSTYQIGVGTSVKLEANSNGIKINNTSDFRGFYASGSVALDFGSIAANNQLELTFTLNGVLPGDIAIVNPIGSYSGGLDFFARVSANNTVTIRARNHTASAIDPASINFGVVCFRG